MTRRSLQENLCLDHWLVTFQPGFNIAKLTRIKTPKIEASTLYSVKTVNELAALLSGVTCPTREYSASLHTHQPNILKLRRNTPSVLNVDPLNIRFSTGNVWPSWISRKVLRTNHSPRIKPLVSSHLEKALVSCILKTFTETLPNNYASHRSNHELQMRLRSLKKSTETIQIQPAQTRLAP